MLLHRRDWLRLAAAGVLGLSGPRLIAADKGGKPSPLRITGLKVTPIALPDPPLLAASGCHGPYFLRNVVELETDSGLTGLGETHGGESVTRALEQAKAVVVDRNVFAFRAFARELL